MNKEKPGFNESDYFKQFQEIDDALNEEILSDRPKAAEPSDSGEEEIESLVDGLPMGDGKLDNPPPAMNAPIGEGNFESPSTKSLDETVEEDFSFKTSFSPVKKSSERSRKEPFLGDEFIYEKAKNKKHGFLSTPTPKPHKVKRLRRRTKKRVAKLVGLIILITLLGVAFVQLENYLGPKISDYELGRNAHRSQDYEEAIKLYSEYIEENSEGRVTEQAKYSLAGCFEMIEDFNGAMSQYRGLIQDCSNEELAALSLYNLAALEMKLGSNESARKNLSQMIETYPKSLYVRKGKPQLLFARVLENEQNWEEAVAYYYLILDQPDFQDDGEVRFKIGRGYEILEEVGTAQNAYREIVRDPLTEEVWRGKAQGRLSQLYQSNLSLGLQNKE